jgi:hypothetical protein
VYAHAHATHSVAIDGSMKQLAHAPCRTVSPPSYSIYARCHHSWSSTQMHRTDRVYCADLASAIIKQELKTESGKQDQCT